MQFVPDRHGSPLSDQRCKRGCSSRSRPPLNHRLRRTPGQASRKSGRSSPLLHRALWIALLRPPGHVYPGRL